MTDSIYKKLLAVQTELKAPKQQFNKFGNYSYRSCEDILNAAKPVLKKHGLTLYITDSLESLSDRVYVVASCVITDGEKEVICNGYAREAESRKGMDASQITGSASSYARKYALSGLFLLDDSKDVDAHETQQSAPDDVTQQINDLKAEIKSCDNKDELAAHYKANAEFVEANKLHYLYTNRKNSLA